MMPPPGSFENGTDVAVARRLLYSAVAWLGVAVAGGAFMAVLLAFPTAQELLPASLKPILNFGRVRAVHVNLAVYGWLSMAYAGSMLFLVPRLAGARLFSARLGDLTVWLWNILMALALASLLQGMNQGREYAEMAWPLDLLFLAILVCLAVNVWGTVARRTEGQVYITVWNTMLAVLLTPIIYAVGNKVWDPSGAYAGMNDNIVNFFYVHNMFNAWFTTGGLGLALYLVPRLAGRPLHSHRLAFWGLLTVWTGQHHQLWSPAPDWLEILTVSFSVLAIIPNAAFFWNCWKTTEGTWSRVREDLPFRFLLTFLLFYLLTCAQGVLHSFRTFSAYIHFTNWVVGHTHLAFVAAYSFLMFAMIYFLLPRLSARRWHSTRLIALHYWMSLVGVSVFMVALWAAGIVQGADWSRGGIPFAETMLGIRPYFFARLAGGAVLAAGQLVFVYNVLRTAASSLSAPAPSEAAG